MSHIWTFCPSSEPYLKRCLDAVKPQNAENKWVKKFKRNIENSTHFEESEEIKKDDIIEVLDIDNDDVKVVSGPPQKKKLIVEPGLKVDDEEFLESVEYESTLKLDIIVSKCLDSPVQIDNLAEKLSTTAIEKICKRLFAETDVNKQFLENFYVKFFPALIKKEYTMFSLDLLMKAGQAHPLPFRKLMKTLLIDLQIPNKLLQDYFENLEENRKKIFMDIIIETELSQEEFEHNLYTILVAYKVCKNNDLIQDYVGNLLVKYGEHFRGNKNYGKLLLAYLQELKNFKLKNTERLEKTIENHQSAFKKPCMNVFKDLLARDG